MPDWSFLLTSHNRVPRAKTSALVPASSPRISTSGAVCSSSSMRGAFLHRGWCSGGQSGAVGVARDRAAWLVQRGVEVSAVHPRVASCRPCAGASRSSTIMADARPSKAPHIPPLHTHMPRCSLALAVRVAWCSALPSLAL